MCDETNSAESSPELPPKPERASSPAFVAPRNRGASHWLKRLLACNPFYLVSAALLLFGMYRVSIDPNFLRTETAQLIFNFTSLQFYELLLVFTAVFLTRRCIWYDATLLVVLENLFVLVPFILVSQAALIEPRTVWVLCAAAALIALGRSAAARRPIYVRAFSPGLLAGGLAVLAANTALPILYRTLHETKFGTKLATGAAYEMNEVSWLWVLPALCALANLLPRPRENGELLVQRRWFPVGLLLLWLIGTGVHLYSLGYVYDFDLRRELLAPALCVLAWTLYARLNDFVAPPPHALRRAALVLPLLATLAAAGVERSHIFFALTVLNALAFTGIVIVERDNRVALHLLLVTVAAFVAAVPKEWIEPATVELSRAKLIAAASAAYLLLCAALSRNPKAAIPGAFAAAFVGGVLCKDADSSPHWAMQAGMVFFLLHSLRWRDHEHQGAGAVRAVASLAWIVQSFAWVRNGVPVLLPLSIAAVVFAVCGLRWFIRLNWSPVVVPIAAVMVGLCSPANLAFVKLQTTPIGIMAIAGSFLLFGLGTIAALTKHRWNVAGRH